MFSQPRAAGKESSAACLPLQMGQSICSGTFFFFQNPVLQVRIPSLKGLVGQEEYFSPRETCHVPLLPPCFGLARLPAPDPWRLLGRPEWNWTEVPGRSAWRGPRWKEARPVVQVFLLPTRWNQEAPGASPRNVPGSADSGQVLEFQAPSPPPIANL